MKPCASIARSVDRSCLASSAEARSLLDARTAPAVTFAVCERDQDFEVSGLSGKWGSIWRVGGPGSSARY